MDRQPASLRLTKELCKRHASCVETNRRATSIDAVASEDCIDRERPRVEAELGSWNCSPAAERARLEECLTAVQIATCEPIVAGKDHLPLCPENVACGPDRTTGRVQARRP
jgi:hypothetical protein